MSEIEENDKDILSSHAKWIRELQESLKVLKQDVSLLEDRVSAFENEIAEMSKVHRKLMNKVDDLSAEIDRKSAESE